MNEALDRLSERDEGADVLTLLTSIEGLFRRGTRIGVPVAAAMLGAALAVAAA